MIYWFIGQPGAGKSTLARHFQNYLRDRSNLGVCLYIDGDDLRSIFNSGYTPEVLTESYRKDQTRQLQKLIAYLSNQEPDIPIIISTVNGFRDVREEFKKSNKVTEIYVTTSDTRGRENFHISTFEPPLEKFIQIDTSGKTISESLNELITKVFH